MLLRPGIIIAACAVATTAHAGLITSVPGPDDQGGMIMPQVYILGADDPWEPTRGTLGVSFDPHSPPVLAGLQHWSPGNWFAPDAAWRPDLGSPAGAGGTPAANAGRGDYFNCQFGFTFLADPALGAAFVPTGKCLAIRLVSVSSPLLRAFNYDDFADIWDEVLGPSVRPQVLWDGSMWHNYYTLPPGATPGTYSATYEVFIADRTFTPGTGFVDYSPEAVAAAADPAFTPARITYTWVVPEPPRATIHFAHGVPAVDILSTAGRGYQLQRKDAMAAEWTDSGAPRAGTGGVLRFTDPSTPRPPARFYRVVETP